MSRAERERWQIGAEHWPNLQQFLSAQASDVILGDETKLDADLREIVSRLSPVARQDIASECRSFLDYFKVRYDDWAFLRDGFGVTGKPPADHGGRGQQSLSRIERLYAVLAEAIRKEAPAWQPSANTKTV